VFTGLQAHASSDPWRGRNALDALILLFGSVGLWRQQLRPTARVHGIITEGGTAANIIPERTSAWFMIRSDDLSEYERMREAFETMCRAAALATGTDVSVAFSGFATTMVNNPVLAERFRANMAPYGIVDMGDDLNAGSTDMANVSWVCPTIHPDLAICDQGVAGHSIEFRDASALPRADETTLLAATLVAQTAYELFADPELVTAAWAAFHAETDGRSSR
jgi:metal-dependent amidase/aminoacylase/carboxypeptidase family protein